MEGHDPQEPQNDQHQQPVTLPLAQAKKSRRLCKYYIAIPTAWTERGHAQNLPKEDSPRYHHVGSRNLQASFELLYISSRGLTELGDHLYTALAERTILPLATTTEVPDHQHPLSLLEILIDTTWLLGEHAMETRHPTGIPVVTPPDISARGIIGLIEALNWEWHRRRYP